MSTTETTTVATDEGILAKLRAINSRLGQPVYDALPLGKPGEQSCVFGCALNGAVEGIACNGFSCNGTDPQTTYDSVEFEVTSEEAGEVLADVLNGTYDPDTREVVVSGDTPEMRWMKLYDDGKKPHLIAEGPSVLTGREWNTYALRRSVA